MSTQRDPVADELAIRNLVARYSDAVIRDDGDDWRACWHPDAVWMLGPGRFEGIEEPLANIGGTIGLWAGLSMLTLTDIGFLIGSICMTLGQNLRRKRNNVETIQDEELQKF